MKSFNLFIFSIVSVSLAMGGMLGCKSQEEDPNVVFEDGASQPYISVDTISAKDTDSESITLAWEKATKNGEEDPELRYQVYFSTEANLYTTEQVHDGDD